MSDKIDKFLVQTASMVNPQLSQALIEVGHVPLTVKNKLPICERLGRAIAGQQLSVTVAATIWGRVSDAAARAGSFRHYVDRASVEQLRAHGLSAAETKAMKAIATEALAGRLHRDLLLPLAPQERAARLCSLWGVGQWTAHMINMFYFGERDIWPEGDMAARKAFAFLLGSTETASAAEKFAPYRSYLALRMWRFLAWMNRKECDEIV